MSQSGKGGVAYIIEKDRVIFTKTFTDRFFRYHSKIADETGKELEADLIWDTFNRTYIEVNGKYEYLNHEIVSKNNENNKQIDEINLNLRINGKDANLHGKGNGPIDCLLMPYQVNSNLI